MCICSSLLLLHLMKARSETCCFRQLTSSRVKAIGYVIGTCIGPLRMKWVYLDHCSVLTSSSSRENCPVQNFEPFLCSWRLFFLTRAVIAWLRVCVHLKRPKRPDKIMKIINKMEGVYHINIVLSNEANLQLVLQWRKHTNHAYFTAEHLRSG